MTNERVEGSFRLNVKGHDHVCGAPLHNIFHGKSFIQHFHELSVKEVNIEEGHRKQTGLTLYERRKYFPLFPFSHFPFFILFSLFTLHWKKYWVHACRDQRDSHRFVVISRCTTYSTTARAADECTTGLRSAASSWITYPAW